MKRCTSLFITLFVFQGLFGQERRDTSLYFDHDSSRITQEHIRILNKLFQRPDTIPFIKATIHGYCSEKGSTDYNQNLSEIRAKNVETYIHEVMNLGVSFEVSGQGELENDTRLTKPEAEAKNRRVDITIVTRKTVVVVEDTAPAQDTVPLIAKTLEVGDKIILKNILFIGGRHELLPESLPHLNKLTAYLKDNPKLQITILGHICCKPTGVDGYDFDTGLNNLSVARAEKIYTLLIEEGIDADRLKYKGLKANFKLGKGDKYDRRVEIQIDSVGD